MKQTRFRIHRSGSFFNDRCTVEIFVISEGRVAGTVRNIEGTTGFVPIEFQIQHSRFEELRSAWSNAISTEDVPMINVGFGDFGERLEIKHLRAPDQVATVDNIRLWDALAALCAECIAMHDSAK